MRIRALVVAAVALAASGAGTAAAQQPTPTARMSAPATVTGGSPVWIRSIDPCPVIPGAYQYVVAGFTPQIVPEGEPAGTVSDGTTADLRADGSWEVTVTAPSEFPEGATKTYSIQASCEVVSDPYRVDDTAGDPSVTTSAAPQHQSIMRYALRPVRVSSPAGSAVVSPASDDSTPTTSPTASTTTSSTPATTTTQPVPTTPPTMQGQALQAQSFDDPTSAADVRRELELRERSSADASLASAAGTSPISATGPADEGIPWWAFALATMLAVGAIVAYGAKRQSVVAAGSSE